eukprot:11195320-Lingulodinium_polyedra.AAC.1
MRVPRRLAAVGEQPHQSFGSPHAGKAGASSISKLGMAEVLRSAGGGEERGRLGVAIKLMRGYIVLLEAQEALLRRMSGQG